MTAPPPPPLDYRPPERPSAGSVNRWWMVCLRILAGLCIGFGSGLAGWALDAATHYNVPVVFLVPPLTVLAIALFIAIRYHRFGYVTGILLAPLVTAVGLVVLLFIICGGGLGH